MTRSIPVARAVLLGLACALAGCGGEDVAEPPLPPAPAPPGGDPRQTPSPRLSALARTDVPGFVRKGERATAAAAIPWYEAENENAAGWRIVAVVTLGPCAPCKPLDLATWKSHEAEMKGVLPPVHRADPALVFDLFEIELQGRRGVALHKRSFLPSSVVHGLTVWWNDGRDEISIDLTARGPADAPAAESASDLDVRASRRDFVRAAQSLFAGFSPSLSR